ncbi:MAG: hypothetical protein ACR2IR_09490 [Acidimicrobiia bacterium]
MSADWFWEGNVARAVASHLETEGWAITFIADTASRQRGVDVLAEKDGRVLAVEVKGFPSKAYADPRRAGEQKRTSPSTQANHWFAQALLAAMKYRGDRPDADIAVAFPDYSTYRRLLARTRASLDLLRLGVYLVREGGVVTRLDSTEDDCSEAY